METTFSYNDLQILFEDENIIAVDKPAGLASIHDSAGEKTDLQTILSDHFKKKVLVVHRLDKEVSGVILFAKNSITHKLLNRQFAERTVKKSYLALVHGKVEKEEGVISFPIREFGSGKMGVDKQKGKPCKTFYTVLKSFSSATLLELNPTTGRRHQLRVHLYAIGYPIIGDLRYGEKEVQKKFPRLMLHAKNICFENSQKNIISIESPIPAEFEKYINELN